MVLCGEEDESCYLGHHYSGVSMPANRTVTGVPSKLNHLRGVPWPHNARAIKNTEHLLTSPKNHVLLLLCTCQEATTLERNRHRENRHLHG
ncbi:hypothetical protein HID58_053725 [Brassica napus]|uniref:Uncharacterized protein n=1 Tax=Brassica napus TaxID=3708 RepID=A0ABQ8AFI1_BRANA|nr:hypothetical protein HID58_053725 [Brassica napus]